MSEKNITYGTNEIDKDFINKCMIRVSNHLADCDFGEEKPRRSGLSLLYIESAIDTHRYNETIYRNTIDQLRATNLEQEKQLRELQEVLNEVSYLCGQLIENYIDLSAYERNLVLAKLGEYVDLDKKDSLGKMLDLLQV